MKVAPSLLAHVFVLLTGTACYAADPVEVKLFDNMARMLSVSPDGKLLAVAEEGPAIALAQVPGGEIVHRLAGHTDRVHSVHYSPDGKTLVSGGYDKTIRLWSTESGDLLRTVTAIGDVADARFSPDGSMILVSYLSSQDLQVLDPHSLAEVRRVVSPVTPPTDPSNLRARIAFSPDGSFLVAAYGGRSWPQYTGEDSTITVLDARDWKLRAMFPGDRFTIDDLDVSPDGQWLAGATNRGKMVKIWKIPPQRESKNVNPAEIDRLIQGLDADQFAEREAAQRGLAALGLAAKEALDKARSSESAEVRFRARRLLAKLLHGETRPTHILKGTTFDVHSVAFSPDGKYLASGRQFDKPGHVIVWQLGDAPRRIAIPHRHGAWNVLFTPDGKWFMTSRKDGHVTFWKWNPPDGP